LHGAIVNEIFGLSGVLEVERAAYQYELDSADRFGLSLEEQAEIKQTMDFFYSKKAN